MFVTIVLLVLISIEMHSIYSLPVPFETVHYTKTNFMPANTDRILKSILMKTSVKNSTFFVHSFRQRSRKNRRKPHSEETTLDEDSIKFVDLDNGTLEEGSVCRRSVDGVSGYCMPSTHCSHVLRELKMYGTKIDVCGYEGPIAIICCPLGPRKTVAPKTTTPIPTRSSVKYCQWLSKPKVLEVPGLQQVTSAKSEDRLLCTFHIPLIVGGKDAAPGEFPHMAAIGWTKADNTIKWSCGGSLISDRYVLTAAHCTQIAGHPPTIVRLGANHLHTFTTSHNRIQDYKINEIIKHPLYNPNSYYNDIALIHLRHTVHFSQFVRPACLSQSNSFDLMKVTATGWGRLGFRGRKSKDLQKVELSLIDSRVCNNSFAPQSELDAGIANTQICAGHLDGGKDTCQGDSGGPLQVRMAENRCLFQIIGITSFGKLCAAPNSPGVYTNVYSYLDWIEMHVFESE